MYCTGHVLSSTLLAALGSRRLNLRFVPLASLLIAVNAIDYDHLLQYRLDDGTANSLALHGLHLYGGVLIFLVTIGALLKPRFLPWAFMLASGLALHYAADALSHAVHYAIPVLMALDVLMLLLLLGVRRPVMGAFPLKGYRGFFAAAAAVCTGAQGFLHYDLGLRPPSSMAAYVLSPTLTLLVACAFFLVFNRREKSLLSAPDSGGSSPGVDSSPS